MIQKNVDELLTNHLGLHIATVARSTVISSGLPPAQKTLKWRKVHQSLLLLLLLILLLLLPIIIIIIIIIINPTVHNRPDIVMLDRSTKEACLMDVSTPNNHNFHSTITEKLQKHINLKEELTRIWQLNTIYIAPLVLTTTGIIPSCMTV
jgi:hypothetical protein